MVISLVNKEDIANRKLPPKNPKYAKIESTIDCGFHVNNIKTIKKKTGEPFRRIKGSELCQLIRSHRPRIIESIYGLEDHTHNTEITHTSDDLHDQNQDDIHKQKPYVLIDVRPETEQYQQYHIESSIHFPNYMFRRDKIPHEIYTVRTIPNSFVIVCSDAEEEGITGATILVQKGVQNVYLLSTSIQKFLSRFIDLSRGSDPPEQAPPKKQIWDPKLLKKRYLHGNRSTASVRTNMSTRTWVP